MTMVTVETFCAVYGCNILVKARNLCPKHYQDWQVGRTLPAHSDLAGKLQWRDDDSGEATWVCNCKHPKPEAIGMCTKCGFLVVTYVHSTALRKVYRIQYPDQYNRALKLGLVGHDGDA